MTAQDNLMRFYQEIFFCGEFPVLLLYRDTFCKISWLVNIGTFNDRHMVGKELQGYNHQDGG